MNFLDEKLEELIELRNEEIKITDADLEYINRQERIKKEVEESKRKVTEQRNVALLK